MTAAQKKLDAEIKKITKQSETLASVMPTGSIQRQNSEIPMQDWEASGGKGKGKGWGYPNDQYGSGKGAKGRGHDNVWQGQAPSWNSGSDWYSWYGRNGTLILHTTLTLNNSP